MSPGTKQNRQRTYRSLVKPPGLVGFRTMVQETDLFVHAAVDLQRDCRDAVLKHRGYIEAYIAQHPGFATALTPWPSEPFMPQIVRAMADAGQRAGVGPMAAVAGAVAEAVGRDLMASSPEIIVENGGDIFLCTAAPLIMAVYAGDSPLNMKFGIRIEPSSKPQAVCTSSGRIGHSLSLGSAHAVCVMSESGSVADASATAIGNRIRGAGDLPKALEFGRSIPGISGILAIFQDRMAVWGAVELVPLKGKKG